MDRTLTGSPVWGKGEHFLNCSKDIIQLDPISGISAHSRGGTTWNFYLEDDFESLNQNGHLGFKKPLKLKPLKGKRKKNSPFNIPKATILSHEWCTQTIVSFSASMFPTGSWTILMRKGRGRRSQNGRSRQNSSALHPPPPVPAILIPSDI